MNFSKTLLTFNLSDRIMFVPRKLLSTQVKNLIARRTITAFDGTRGINSDWLKAKSNAENLVGFHYYDFEKFLTQQLNYIILYFQNNSEINDSLFQAAKKLIFLNNFAHQTKGLMTLLIFQVASHIKTNHKNLSSILPKQQKLAKISEILYSIHIIHCSIKDISTKLLILKKPNAKNLKNNYFILSGDFLLTTVWKLLSEIQNIRVFEIMFKGMSDFLEGQFIVENEAHVLTQPGHVNYWKKTNFLTNASLQANSCRSSLILGNFDETAQLKAYEFGKSFAYSMKIFTELFPFLEPFNSNNELLFNLNSVPVLAHFELTGDKLFTLQNPNVIDTEKLYAIINSGPGIGKAKEMRDNFAQKALDALGYFPSSQASNAINHIIQVIKSQ